MVRRVKLMINRVYHITGSLVLLLFFTLTLSTSVYSSSFHGTGKLKELNPVDGRDKDRGHCLFYTGPHGEFLQEGEFLLILIDDEHEDGVELEMTGTFEMEGERIFNLFPDEDFAEKFLESVLGEQLGGENIDLVLNKFRAKVVYPRNVFSPQNIGEEELINCRVKIKGKLMEGDEELGRVKISFNGSGLHFADFHGEFEAEEVPSQTTLSSQVTRESSSCPKPNLTPDGGNFCNTSNCLVDFAGYKWWTLYHYDPNNGYYYNGGLQTIFAPQNVSVDSEGLHLRITKQDLGGPGGKKWSGAEAVAVQNPDGSQANLGFGTYLVSMKVKSAPSWSELDPNVALGLFTFQKDKTGDENNPYREIDLAEVSRWGNPPGTTREQCNLSPKSLCDGNAQFAIQLWNKVNPSDPPNVHRYTIADNVQEITLVMEWTAAHQPVTFKQYNGRFTLETLPATADNVFTTAEDQNPFIPDSDCQRFHMNFWMGNFGKAVEALNPGPSNGQPQDVVITNFQYQPIN
jgi:hypothetical protein